MKKKGFTLAEALIAMMIIGVVVALLMRTLSRVTPDKEKVMYVKAYHTFEQVIADTINDPNRYDQEYYLDKSQATNSDFSQDPLDPSGRNNPKVEINGASKSVNKSNAICYYVAEKLNIIEKEPNCSSSSKENPNFRTSNGLVWWGLEGAAPATGAKTINVDVNGKTDDGDMRILLYKDGKVSPPEDGKEAGYLEDQTKIR